MHKFLAWGDIFFIYFCANCTKYSGFSDFLVSFKKSQNGIKGDEQCV